MPRRDASTFRSELLRQVPDPAPVVAAGVRRPLVEGPAEAAERPGDHMVEGLNQGVVPVDEPFGDGEAAEVAVAAAIRVVQEAGAMEARGHAKPPPGSIGLDIAQGPSAKPRAIS